MATENDFTEHLAEFLEDLEAPFVDNLDIFLDIEGNIIPDGLLYMDSGKWHYNGKLLMVDVQGRVQTQYAADAYRDPQPAIPEDDDSPPSSAKASRGKESSEETVKRPSNDPRRPLLFTPTTDENVKFPKMRDLNINKASSSRISQPPKPVPIDHAGDADTYYVMGAREIDLHLVPGDPRKRRHIGYEAHELILQGAIQCWPCRSSDLVYSPELDVFREENFLEVPSDVLDFLKPSLALAEHIIRRGSPRFWIDIACGDRVYDWPESIRTNVLMERLYPVTSITHAMEQKTWQKLQKMGETIFFRFGGKDAYGSAANYIHHHHTGPANGATLTPDGMWPRDKPFRIPHFERDPWKLNSVITISDDFYNTAKAFVAQKYPDTAAVLRFQFFFTVNLLHEIAHSFEAKCGNSHYYDVTEHDFAMNVSPTGVLSKDYPKRFNEATYKQYHPTEIGWSFEEETFGGRVTPINGDVRLAYGICIVKHNGERQLTEDALHEWRHGRPVGRSISMGFIEEIFQQSYWSRPPNPNGLLVPSVGAITFLTTRTTTVSWQQYFNNDNVMQLDHISDALEADETNEPSKPAAKRARRASPPNQSAIRGRHGMPRRRLLQPTIRKYAKGADVEEAKMRAEMIAHAAIEAAAAETNQAIELAKEEALRRYRAPSPDQPAIDETFRYHSTQRTSDDNRSSSDSLPAELDPTSELYDPLLKPAHQLTLEDKWILLEEYLCFTQGLDPATFHARRLTNTLGLILPQFMPTDDEESAPQSWGPRELAFLKDLRTLIPDQSRPYQIKQKIAQREAKRALWTIVAEMEELAVYKGYSRISFQRCVSSGLPLPDGMTVGNFNSQFRSQLLAFREVERVKAMASYREAIATGQVVVPAAMVAEGGSVLPLLQHQQMFVSHDPRSLLTRAEEEEEEGEGHDGKAAIAVTGRNQANKITRYFPVSRSQASQDAGVRAPEDGTEKEEKEAGADVKGKGKVQDITTFTDQNPDGKPTPTEPNESKVGVVDIKGKGKEETRSDAEVTAAEALTLFKREERYDHTGRKFSYVEPEVIDFMNL